MQRFLLRKEFSRHTAGPLTKRRIKRLLKRLLSLVS
jgi:hypothetical protein